VSTPLFTEAVADTVAGFDIPVELHLLDNANRIVEARISRVSPSLFNLTCSEDLKEGQRLALSHEGRRIEVAVSSVAQDAAGVYLLAVRVVNDEDGEVRSELRLPTDLAAILRVAGETEQIATRVVDMSASGMGIEVPVSLARGAKVCINLEQGLAFGEIRFCREKSAGVYFAGFLLEEYIGRE
jgi:hypothetical protein